MSDVQKFIEHHGVKGMRWGVRRGRNAKSGKAAAPARPKAKDLSDEELRKAISRMQMEQQYNSLSSGKKKAGSEFVKGIGTTVVKTAITAVATQQVNTAMKKAKITT